MASWKTASVGCQRTSCSPPVSTQSGALPLWPRESRKSRQSKLHPRSLSRCHAVCNAPIQRSAGRCPSEFGKGGSSSEPPLRMREESIIAAVERFNFPPIICRWMAFQSDSHPFPSHPPSRWPSQSVRSQAGRAKSSRLRRGATPTGYPPPPPFTFVLRASA